MLADTTEGADSFSSSVELRLQLATTHQSFVNTTISTNRSPKQVPMKTAGRISARSQTGKGELHIHIVVVVIAGSPLERGSVFGQPVDVAQCAVSAL